MIKIATLIVFLALCLAVACASGPPPETPPPQGILIQGGPGVVMPGMQWSAVMPKVPVACRVINSGGAPAWVRAFWLYDADKMPWTEQVLVPPADSHIFNPVPVMAPRGRVEPRTFVLFNNGPGAVTARCK